MPSKRTHDVTATVGEYTASNGAVKKRYVNCGSAFTDEQGRVSIKLDATPCSPEWSGWFSLYPIKDKDDREQQRRRESPADRYGKQPYTPPADDDDGSDIPF